MPMNRAVKEHERPEKMLERFRELEEQKIKEFEARIRALEEDGRARLAGRPVDDNEL